MPIQQLVKAASSRLEPLLTMMRFCHINVGAIVKVGVTVEEYTKLEAGEIALGYQQAIEKK